MGHTVTRAEQEASIGRRLSDRSPATGWNEKDDLDLTAASDGRPVISLQAHARLAHPTMSNGFRIFRKGLTYSYDDGSWTTESGLLFLSYPADIARVRRRCSSGSTTPTCSNESTTAVGSAVVAVLPGLRECGWLGEALLG